MDVGPGDEVVLQAFTCLAVPLPILAIGARPVYADIDSHTRNLDLSKLPSVLSPRTKAIVVQHTFGVPADMDAVLDLARERHLFVIEDCCHTVSSRFNGREVGTFGEAAFYSWEWGKPVVLGLGGTAVVNTPELERRVGAIYQGGHELPAAEVFRVRLQRIVHSRLVTPTTYWFFRDAFHRLSRARVAAGTFEPGEVAGRLVDFDRRMPRRFQASLDRKLSRRDDDRRFRAWAASEYAAGLAAIGLRPPSFEPAREVAWVRYPIHVRDKARVLARARQQRIEVGDWFSTPVDPLDEPQWETVGYRKGSCPTAEVVARRVVTLPIYRRVTARHIARAVRFLAEMAAEEAV